jgi:DNA invertase Pin-like site-specific DNA recombinase
MAERTKAGLAATKAKGRIGGRKRKMTESKIESAKQLLSSGSLPKDVVQNIGISVATLYRWVPASELNTILVGSNAPVEE